MSLFARYCKFLKFNKFKSIANYRGMKVIPLLANEDNYMYIMYDDELNAAAVDPYDYRKILDTVNEFDLKLTHILTTHHHWDHAGGNKAMLSHMPNLIICGGCDRVEAVNCIVKAGNIINIGSISVQCIETPCHTSSHICYYSCDHSNDDPPCVFTGDTLFLAGCGKFFEGTPAQMVECLIEKLCKLPAKTLVYCGHEYTVNNLKFATTIEPDNKNITAKLSWAVERRLNNQPTIPSTIGEELEINVFMRSNRIEIQKRFKLTSTVDLMGFLRDKKNKFIA